MLVNGEPYADAAAISSYKSRSKMIMNEQIKTLLTYLSAIRTVFHLNQMYDNPFPSFLQIEQSIHLSVENPSLSLSCLYQTKHITSPFCLIARKLIMKNEIKMQELDSDLPALFD